MYPNTSWLSGWLRTHYKVEPAGGKMSRNEVWRIERQREKSED